MSFQLAKGRAGQRSDGFMSKAPCGHRKEKEMVARGSGSGARRGLEGLSDFEEAVNRNLFR